MLKLSKALGLLLIGGLVGCGSSYHVEAELIPHINKVEDGVYKLVIGIPLGGIETDFEYAWYGDNILSYAEIFGRSDSMVTDKEDSEEACTPYDEEGNEIYYNHTSCITIYPTKEGVEKIKDEDYTLVFYDEQNQEIATYKTKLLKVYDFCEILEELE